jgi:hypothetical protein
MTTTTNFSLAHCKTLKFTDAIQYITDFFIPLDDGTHAFNNGEKWIVHTEDVIRRVYFNRLSPLLNDYYFKEYDRILTPIYDKTKAQFGEGFINFDFKTVVLDAHYRFIVEEFINKKEGLNHKPKELYEMYVKYNDGGDVVVNKTQFGVVLAEVGIKTIKSGTNMYKISYDELFTIGLAVEWYFRDSKDVEIDTLKAEIDALKAEVEELKNIEYVEVESEDIGVGCDESEFEECEGEMEYEEEQEEEDDDEMIDVEDDLIEKLL